MQECYPDRFQESTDEQTNICCLTCSDIDENFKEEHENDEGNCLCYACRCTKCYWYNNGNCEHS
jgi:hypothetical protein